MPGFGDKGDPWADKGDDADEPGNVGGHGPSPDTGGHHDDGLRDLPAPGHVLCEDLPGGGFRISWVAIMGQFGQLNSVTRSRLVWSIRYCPATSAGTQDGDNNWPETVYKLSRELTSREMGADNQSHIVSYTDPTLLNGYVLVVATAGTNARHGQPSYPHFVNFEESALEIAPEPVTAGAITVEKRRDPDYLRFTLSWTRPVVTTYYGGVHPHITGYAGGSLPSEVGSPDLWDGTIVQTAIHNLPLETGLGNGTAVFTSGSGTVTKVSGDNFVAGFVGRKILIDTSSTTAVVYQVSARASNTSMTITPVFAGSTGTKTYKVLNAITFYLVSISQTGARDPDYTTAATLSV